MAAESEITDAMVEAARDTYRWKVAEYARDFADPTMTGAKWKEKYGTNLHSTGLGEAWAMRAVIAQVSAALSAALAAGAPGVKVGWETPEEWKLEIRVCQAANRSDMPEDVRQTVQDLWKQYCLAARPADDEPAPSALVAEPGEPVAPRAYEHKLLPGTYKTPEEFAGTHPDRQASYSPLFAAPPAGPVHVSALREALEVIEEARRRLAAWDIAALPNDMTLLEIVDARIDDRARYMAVSGAADKLFWSAKEFIDDWKKGDFRLPTLAEHDARSLDDALTRYADSRATAPVAPSDTMRADLSAEKAKRERESLASMEKIATLRLENRAAIAASDRMREAAQTAVELLKETRHGSPARSPGHNARLVLEAALAQSAAPVQPSRRDFWLHYDHQGAGRWCVENEPPRVIRPGAEVIHVREISPVQQAAPSGEGK